MRQYEVKQLQKPRKSTTAAIVGTWIDTQGLINQGTREAKFVLEAGAGTTAGTCGGIVQSAVDTAGTGAATVVTFDTLTSSGGVNEKHGVIPAAHRYVKFTGSIQAAKDMILAASMIGEKRTYSPS